jgi:hypothetical protein
MLRKRPSAIVHQPVLEGRAEAIYIAHRSATEWFVGGPGFTDEPPERFEVVPLRVVRAIDPSRAPALSLPIGSFAARVDGHGSWIRGRIPRGRTFLITYDVRPTPAVSEGGTIGGAFVNCWIVARTIGEARRRSRREVESTGWAVVADGAQQRMNADQLSDEAAPYFRQVQIDGLLLVFYEYPPEPVDA